MDLWIRTQDREKLIQVFTIEVDTWHDADSNKITISDGNDNDLGSYETKERAIEVLNEIQEHRDVLVLLELVPNSEKMKGLTEFHKLRDSLTYEMPKE